MTDRPDDCHIFPSNGNGPLDTSPDGGTGRRARLRGVWLSREGSSPSPDIFFTLSSSIPDLRDGALCLSESGARH